jgi:hypothetical protein
LRYAASGTFSATDRVVLKKRYHIGKLLGYSDDSLLSNSNLDAAVTANPGFQQYLVVAIEGGSSATQVQNIYVRLTYYVRMEVPIAILDNFSRTRHRFEMAVLSAPKEDATSQILPGETASAPPATFPVDSLPPMRVQSRGYTTRGFTVREMIDQIDRLNERVEQLSTVWGGGVAPQTPFTAASRAAMNQK